MCVCGARAARRRPGISRNAVARARRAHVGRTSRVGTGGYWKQRVWRVRAARDEPREETILPWPPTWSEAPCGLATKCPLSPPQPQVAPLRPSM
ncbi:hypothetical protein AGIG_G24143 [Arapaima gigas]